MSLKVNKQFSLKGHKGAIYTLEQVSNTSHFYSAGDDGMVVLWDSHEKDEGKVIAKIDSSIYALHVLSDPNLLLIGQNYQGVHMLDRSAQKVVKSAAITNSMIFDIKSFDDKIYVGTGNGELVILQFPSLNVIQRIQLSSQSVRCIVFNAEKDQMAVGTSENNIHIYDLERGRTKQVIHAHSLSVFSLVFNPLNGYLISAGRDARFKLWNADNNYEHVQSVIGHLFAINHTVFSPDNEFFATCSMDKTIKVWDAKENKLLKVIDKVRHGGHSSSVNKLLWSGITNRLISASDDRTISVWDLEFSN